MAPINPQQLEILKKVLEALGKKPEEIDEFIRKKCEEKRKYREGMCLQTNGNGEITVLDFSLEYGAPKEQKLTGSIPPEIGQLKALTQLKLYENQLSGSIPPEIGQLKALTELNLSRNQLSGSIPPEIGQLKDLTSLRLYDNEELGGALPVLPSGCIVDVIGTHLSTVTVITKPLKNSVDYFMIVQYVALGYADFGTDILVIIELISLNRIGIAIINLFFIVLGIVLGYWNSNRTAWDLVLNVTQLSIFVDGMETLKQGKQTPGLVLGKKMDAIVRSMPSVILQLFSLLIDLEDYPAGTHEYNTFVVSIALGILGASVTLSGLHRKCGNSLLSWQFGVVNLYYFSEILLRCLMIAVAFISVREYAFIVAGFDILLRGCMVAVDTYEWEIDKDKIDISLTCLYLGSDNALNDKEKWFWGSLLTFIETLIFTIVMLTLPTKDLHTMRTRRTASHLAYIMLCAFVSKTYLYYYIEDTMEEPKEEEPELEKKEVVSAI
jgi:hypothetical protein